MQLANKSEHCTLTFDGGVRLAPGATLAGDECARVVAGSAGVSSMFGCGVLVPDAEAQALADQTFGAIVDGQRMPPPPAQASGWAGAEPAEVRVPKTKTAKAAQ